MIAPAPLFADIADAPEGGRAFRIAASDGTQVRFAIWDGGTAGTFLVLPGRTEYIEKYGRVVAKLVSRGYACVVIDWRGQGLSDRPAPDPFIGHVRNYDEYQDDLQTVLDLDVVRALPGPRWMLAHSMGGCIGYRALMDGLDMTGAIFSAPMWGISMTPAKRPLAHVLTTVVPKLSEGPSYAPGGDETPYILKTPFEENVLTGDEPSYDWIRAHLAAHPELGLGGPSYSWLGASLREMARIHAAQATETRCLILLGSAEEVVSPAAINRMVKRLPNADLQLLQDARHEVLIETPALLDQVWSMVDGFLARG